MKMKTEIRLERWERALVMQVLEQDEELREKLDFKASNGWRIWSFSQGPGFSSAETHIFIRGEDESRDSDVVVKYFNSNAERDEYHKNIVQLFKEYNNRDKAEKSEENNIFVLR
jgi:hypothetical protein